MSVWDLYKNRIDTLGGTKRGAFLNRERAMISAKIKDNLSYHSVRIDGKSQDIAIINTDKFNEKLILSLPDNDIRHGGLIQWNNNYWLVTERDTNDTIYTRARMVLCNYQLKWVSDDKKIHSQWCIVKESSDTQLGERETSGFVAARGDSRILLTIAKNEHTLKFNRTNRFLIDDPDSEFKFAYTLSNPLKLGNLTKGDGVYEFVLQEVNTTDDDNLELCVADYYKHFPRDGVENDPVVPDDTTGGSGKKVWL